MKYLMGLILIALSGSEMAEAQTIYVNGDDLTCRPYIGGSTSIVLSADYIKVPGLKHTPSFSTLVDEGGCDVIRELKGKIHSVPVKVEAEVYHGTRCAEGGVGGCYKIGCFEFLYESASLAFSNGLTLRSRTTSPIQTLLYLEECKK